MTKRDDLIAKRAHEIWEQEGRPHGRDEEHWHRAAEAIAAEEGGAAETAESAPKAAKKPRAVKAAGADPAPKRKPAEPAAAPAEKAPRKPKAKPAG